MPKIHVLPPETARLIAAGEVIDRPAAVLREFLDNALDAGARDVQVEIEGGGAALVRVVDDGEGMGREDLELAVLPHATSKIAVADDLLRARSLGFRGEALASIQAAARLEITSRDEAGASAHRLVAGPGTPATIQAVPGRRGTACEASRLFENFPARRQFLKRAQAEAALCRQVLVDKALAHPDVAFRYSSEGRTLLALRPESQEDRVASCYPEAPRDLVYRVRFSGEGFEGSVVLAGPAFFRSDRRLMQVFVNRRRVQDSGLLSALDYAFSGFLPGGAHPEAFLFAEVDPALADFNIHPAKREVRFKDAAALRRGVVKAIQGFLGELARREPAKAAPSFAEASLPGFAFGGGIEGADTYGRGEDGGTFGGGEGGAGCGGGAGRAFGAGAYGGSRGPGASPRSGMSWEELSAFRETAAPLPRPLAAAEGPSEGGPASPRYLGKALGLFLVVESGDALYLIDQHAAHERLLYDELSAGAPAVQELLVPLVYEPEDEAEDARLALLAPALAEAGFGLEREGGAWLLTSAPAMLRGGVEGALRELVALGGAGAKDAAAAARALAACRAAVKDGDELDPASARELALRALALPEPRCPHGRPVWVRLSRSELFRLVRRTV